MLKWGEIPFPAALTALEATCALGRPALVCLLPCVTGVCVSPCRSERQGRALIAALGALLSYSSAAKVSTSALVLSLSHILLPDAFVYPAQSAPLWPERSTLPRLVLFVC